MYKKNILILVLCFNGFAITYAQSKSRMHLEVAIQKLHNAMISADSSMLDKMVFDKLTYGHSNGMVEKKQAFIGKIISGKSDFVSIETEDQTIIIQHKTAIIRHTLNAITNDNNVPGKVHLLVTLVWQKHCGHWKLLARQAVKGT